MVPLACAYHGVARSENALGLQGLDGEASAEKLECIEPEPVRLVFEAH
jgi:hypothetical protein